MALTRKKKLLLTAAVLTVVVIAGALGGLGSRGPLAAACGRAIDEIEQVEIASGMRARAGRDWMMTSGYALDGPYDFAELAAQLTQADVPVLTMKDVEMVDWRKKSGVTVGWGPTFLATNRKTGRAVRHLTFEVTGNLGYVAFVRMSRDGGGKVFVLYRVPLLGWRYATKIRERQVVPN